MTDPDIRDWRSIDAAWLSAVLAHAGCAARVASFTADPVGTGQIGDCVRFSLRYETGAPDAPASLVGKFPAEGEQSRATGIALGNYYREVRFYQHLQHKARIATPRCFFTDVNEDTHDFVLMMEDAFPAVQGDQLAGVTLDQVHAVLPEAARLHAAFWNDESLEAYPWVGGTRHAPEPVTPDMIAGMWPAFVERYNARISPRARALGDAISAGRERDLEIRSGTRSLIHADFRPDNMLFATPAGGRPVTVVDWQSFSFGPPACDVGYFLAGAITPEERRSHEHDLLALYARELMVQGAGPYDQEELIRHYIAGAAQLFVTAYFAAVVVTRTDRGDDMFFRMLNGAVDLIHDWQAQSWYA